MSLHRSYLRLPAAINFRAKLRGCARRWKLTVPSRREPRVDSPPAAAHNFHKHVAHSYIIRVLRVYEMEKSNARRYCVAIVRATAGANQPFVRNAFFRKRGLSREKKAAIKKYLTLRGNVRISRGDERENRESTKDDKLAASDARLQLAFSAALRRSADQARKVALRNRRSRIVWAIAVSAQNCPSFPYSAGRTLGCECMRSSAPARTRICTGYTVHSGRFRCAFFFLRSECVR